MELRHLRHFIAVAERLSFSKAAQALHLTQPALSRQIRDLEEELGCTLFVRRPTEIKLTPDGEHLLAQAGPLLRTADDLVRSMQARGKGRTRSIRLAHFGTFLELYLVPFLQKVHRRHPGWVIELSEHDPAEALRALRRGEVDAATTGRADPALLAGCEARVIWTEQPLIVVPADHALAKKRRLRLRDLARQRLVVWDEAQFPGFGEPFLAACRAAGFTPEIARTVDSVAAVFTTVAREGAVGYVGRLATQVPTPGVACVPLAAHELDMPTLLAWRQDSPGATVLAELAGLLTAQPAACTVPAD